MKTKKVKPLTVRQQIQQCPTLTSEERSLALFGLRKAPHIQPMWNEWALYRRISPNKLSCHFHWECVPVIKGKSKEEARRFWFSISIKLSLCYS